jgi:hypothetical protein
MWAAFMACTAVDRLTGKKQRTSSSSKTFAASSSSSPSSSPASTTKVAVNRSGTTAGKTVRQLLAKALPASQ